MANTGKPKSVKMAKATVPQMKTPKQNTGSRPSKAHPWNEAPASGKNKGGMDVC